MGRLTAEEHTAIANITEEPTGDTLDKHLRDDHGVAPFALLVAKSRVLGFAPWNVPRCKVTPGAFER